MTADDPKSADELPEIDLADELNYIADNPKTFTKAEMAAMMREAAGEIRELRVMLAMQAAVELANTDPEGNA